MTTPLLPERAQSYEEQRERVMEIFQLDDNGQPVDCRLLLDKEPFEEGMYKGWTRQH